MRGFACSAEGTQLQPFWKQAPKRHPNHGFEGPNSIMVVEFESRRLGDGVSESGVKMEEPTGGAEFNPDFDGGEESLCLFAVRV